jgi:hypothetical protein
VETFLGIQIISIMFAIFMMYLVRLHFIRNNIGRKEYFFWNTAWIVFIIFALLPHLLTPVLTKLSVVRALDFLMIVAFMILTYIMFSDHIAIRDLYRKTEKLVSEQSQKNPSHSLVKRKKR